VADGTIKGLVSPVSYQKPDNEIDTTDFSCSTVEWYEGNGTEGKKLSGDDKFEVGKVYTAVINLQPANDYLTLDGIPGGEKFFAIEGAPDGTTVTNDDGDDTGIKVIAVFPETETAEAPTGKVLQSVTTPAAITGVANGTAKNAAALSLPTTVYLVTDQGNVTANVTWDVDSSSYDPATKTEQTFMVNGTFALPAGVENNSAQPIPLTVSVSVTVSAATTTSPYAISLDVTDPYVFPERTVGYTDSPVKSVTVKNIGTADTGALDVVISGVNSKDFTLSKASIQSLTAGNTDSFTLSPDMGLTAGTYNATVAVSGDNGLRASFSATFKVNAATAVSPYAISLDVSGTSYTFPDRTVGYTEPPTKSVTVKNTGTEATGALSVLISGPNSADFTLSKTSIASIAAEKTDAFSINPKTGLSSKAYKATVTVSGDNSLAKSFDVSFTVTAATSGSNETEDEVEKESETDTAIPTNPATKPTTEGVDAGENVKYFKSIDDLPETMAGIVEVNTDGIVVAKPAEVLKGLNAEAKAAVGEKPDVIVPLPAFEADVEKSGNAAVVMFEMDMKDFDELDIDEAVVLKLQSDGQTVLLKRSASAAKINAGQYAWTDAFDDPVPGAHVIDAKGYYHLYVAIKDDGDMDYEKDTPGTVIDPLALAKKQGGGTSLESSGGSGCEAGASGIFAPFALAALALAVKRRGKK
jgi:hypothetical protein